MISKFEINADFVWRLMLFFASMSLIFCITDTALASGSNTDDVIGATLCRLVANLSGGIAKGIATIAIFSVGVGLFLGKLNWGIAAATAAGVGIIFSAPQLVSFLAGSGVDSTCPTG